MAVKPLNHYAMTNPTSVYDEEALTALELAGRTAAKVNENVEAFNQLEARTTERLSNQDNRLTKQENEQIPATVADEVKEYVDNGSFDRAIEKHIGNLENRVDNLLGSVTQGSTTLDAEIIDARRGVDPNENFANLGAAVRDKAKAAAINRFFDNDIFVGQAKNLYPYDDVEFSYPASGVPFPQIGDSEILIEKAGNYMLVVTDTNAPRLMVTYRRWNDDETTIERLMDVDNPKTGVYTFNVPAESAYIRIFYGTSESAPVAGDYYFKRAYIFPEDSVKIPREFINEGLSIFDTVEVIKQKGENLYNGGELPAIDYDGVSLNVNVSVNIPLYHGKYLIKIANTFPRVIITTANDVRIFDESNMSENEFYKFTVPETKDGVKLIGYLATSTAPLVGAGKYKLDNITILRDDGVPFLPDYLTRFDEITNMINNVGTGGSTSTVAGRFMRKTGAFIQSLVLDGETHSKKNSRISCTVKTDSYGVVTLGQGKEKYGGYYIEIIPYSGMFVYKYTTEATNITSHTFTDSCEKYLSIDIIQHNDKADFTITTCDGVHVFKDVEWMPCNGQVFVENNGGTFTDATLTWTSADIEKPVWLFGDSYMGMGDNRIAGQLIKRGCNNFLVSGFPGGGAYDEYTSLTNLLQFHTPDVIVWCVGMNNGDGGASAINHDWLTKTEAVISLCESKNITLVLATIPTVPTVINTDKNEWVRLSGHRYVEFAHAVSDNYENWYDGMLDADEVHPTEKGASALASRMLADVPELML